MFARAWHAPALGRNGQQPLATSRGTKLLACQRASWKGLERPQALASEWGDYLRESECAEFRVLPTAQTEANWQRGCTAARVTHRQRGCSSGAAAAPAAPATPAPTALPTSSAGEDEQLRENLFFCCWKDRKNKRSHLRLTAFALQILAIWYERGDNIVMVFLWLIWRRNKSRTEREIKSRSPGRLSTVFSVWENRVGPCLLF